MKTSYLAAGSQGGSLPCREEQLRVTGAQPSPVPGQNWALFKGLPVEAGSREAPQGWVLAVRVEWPVSELSSVYACKRGKDKFHFWGNKRGFSWR